MLTKAIASLIYGILIATGGIIGWAMAGSIESLLAGGLLGVVAIIGAIMLFMRNQTGQWVALIAAVLVGLFFVYQLVSSMGAEDANLGRPIGVIALSLVEIAILLLVKNPPPAES